MSARFTPHLRVLPLAKDFEQIFQQMAENIQEIFWMLDAASQEVIYVSPAYERICGRSCASLYHAPLSYVETIHPEDRDRILARLGELIRGGEFDEEFRIVRPDGEIRWIANQGFPIRKSSGVIYRVAGVAQDITRRKEVEQALRASEATFATVFQASPCAMTVTTLPEGSFIDVNESFLRQMRFSRNEVIGHNLVELGIFPNPEEFAKLVAEVLQTGKLTNREICIRTKLGQVRTGLYSSEAVQLRGRSCLLTVAEDITERKEAEEKLRRSEREYRSLFEEAPYGILRASLSGKILKANPALVCMLGYSSESDLLAVSLNRDIFGDPDEFLMLTSRVGTTKHFDNVTLRWKRKDRKRICVETSGTIFEDKVVNQPSIDMMVQDISERHALETKIRRAAVMEDIAEIVSGLTHDYSLHLGRMIGYADLLFHLREVKGATRHYIEQIIKAGMQARSVTRCLLGMTRRHELQLEQVRVDELIGELQEFLATLLGPEIKLSIEVNKDLGPVHGNAQKLTQVLIDLVTNARDAMPSGGKLIITASRVDRAHDPHEKHIRPGAYVQIAISDSGHGMDQNTLAHIFDSFFTTKKEGKGAGLGLAYVQLMIEKHCGGEIRVSSQPGGGSTFTMYLPCIADPERLDSKNERDNAKRESTRKQLETILLVTADDVLRGLTSEFLKRGGFEVVPTKTAAEALQAARMRKRRIHLLLADLVPLGASAEQLAQELKSIDRQIKVIYMTEYGEALGLFDSLTQHEAKLLYKPFLSFELIAAVNCALALENAA